MTWIFYDATVPFYIRRFYLPFVFCTHALIEDEKVISIRRRKFYKGKKVWESNTLIPADAITTGDLRELRTMIADLQEMEQ